MSWQRPRKCGAHGSCIEVEAEHSGWILMRATSDPGTVLTVYRDELAAFIDACKAGEYDYHLTETPTAPGKCRCSCHNWSSLDVACCTTCYDGKCRARAVVAGRDPAEREIPQLSLMDELMRTLRDLRAGRDPAGGAR